MTPAATGRRTLIRLVAGTAAVAAAGACTPPRPAPQEPAPPGDAPITSTSLVGKTLRVYHTGDPLTRDYRQDRANIELGPDERIVSIWIG